jgi:hypothetical protein
MNNIRRARSRDDFERVPLSELRQGRQGKHHDLTTDIAAQIDRLPDGEAMKIPLEDVHVSLPNLRSAIGRTMLARDIKVGTFSDGKNLFIWKKTAGTAPYERKPRRPPQAITAFRHIWQRSRQLQGSSNESRATRKLNLIQTG